MSGISSRPNSFVSLYPPIPMMLFHFSMERHLANTVTPCLLRRTYNFPPIRVNTWGFPPDFTNFIMNASFFYQKWGFSIAPPTFLHCHSNGALNTSKRSSILSILLSRLYVSPLLDSWS